MVFAYQRRNGQPAYGCKRVLNLLEAIYWRPQKIVVETVTVVKFGVDDRGSDGTGCFRIHVRSYTRIHCVSKNAPTLKRYS